MTLLYKLAPGLLTTALQKHIESLIHSSNLAVPSNLDPKIDTERKLRAGREETATRALEVVLVQAKVDQDGAVFAQGVVEIADAIAKVEEKRIWESGLRRVLDALQIGSY